MEWLNIESLDELVEIMHVNGRLTNARLSADARCAGDARACARDFPTRSRVASQIEMFTFAADFGDENWRGGAVLASTPVRSV
jgi:hypothetical protein